MIEAQSRERKPSAEGGERLAEDAARLALKLREQARKCRTSRRIDTSGRNQLVDERRNALPAQRRKGRDWNVVKIERVGYVQADVAREIMVDLINPDVQRNLGSIGLQLAQQLCACLQHGLRCPYFHRASLPRAYLLKLTDIAQRRNDFSHILRAGGSRHRERSQRHAVEVLVIFWIIRRQ